MGGPTNTTPRYRPPPPGTAPPPPPPSSYGQHHYDQQHHSQQPQTGGYGQEVMGGQQQPPSSFHQAQMHNQLNQYGQPQQPQQQQQQQPAQQSFYRQEQPHYSQSQQPSPPVPSYYTQQPQPTPQPPAARPPAPAGSYAARSAAAHSPHGSVHSPHGSSHGSPHGSAHGAPSASTNNNTSKPTDPTLAAFNAEQTRLLQNSTRKVAEASHSMQRAMEANDTVGVLEMACLLLEELGDPNHGVKGQGGTGARNAGGQGSIHPQSPYTQPPYYNAAGGAVPPLGNYNHPHHHHHSGSHALITPLSPKNYYELHMRAMDELPPLEEYLLNLCYVPNPGGGGATNFPSHQQLTEFTPGQLHEAVQYCPRVVPRLYLQICMGSVAIRSGWREAVDVMNELGEAAKCVQCPVRGLFLRYFLLMALKDKLPDGPAEGGDFVGDVASGVVDPLASAASMLEPTSPPPPVPPPSLPPPPPPAEESSLLKHSELFPDQSKDGDLFGDSVSEQPKEGDLFGDSVSTPTAEKKSSLSKNTTLFPEETGDLFGDSGSGPLFSEPVSGPSPLDDNKVSAAPASSPPVSPPAAAPINPPAPTSTTKPTPSPQGPHKGTVQDSYDFILQNLFEMNRLWIRIQHMPGDKSKETKRRRERERNDLRILVGSNLNRLSQLEGISARTYGSCILPRILEEVASCRDPLAQAYLMDCIIQVFPDEFHLETLEVFLGVLPKLRDKVNVRTILNNMMERLLHYYQEETLVNGEADTNDVKRTMAIHSFDMFEDCVKRVFEARGVNIPPKDVIRLQGALLSYTLKIAPGNIDHISRCIGQCARELGTLQEQKKASMMGQGIVVGGVTRQSMELDMEEVAITELEKLLSVPLDQVALKVLNMPEFSSLLAFLPWENRRKVAISMLKAVVSGGEDSKVKDVGEEEQLFAIIAPLLRDQGVAPPGMYDHAMEQGGSLISRTANLMGTLGISSSGDAMYTGGTIHSKGDPAKMAQFREEQTLVAKLVNVLEHEDTDTTYQMLNVARKYLQPGGAERVSVTMPALVFASLKLLRRVQQLEFPRSREEPADKAESADEDGAEETITAADSESADKSRPTEDKATEEAEADNNKSAEEKAEPAEDKSSTEVTEGENNIGDVDASAMKTDEGMNGGAAVKQNESANGSASNKDVKEELAPLFAKTVNCRKILVFLQKTVAMLASNSPELAFKLYLEIAVSTDLLAHSTRAVSEYKYSSTEFSGISYDFMTQAFLVYEDEISESKAQIRSITSIVGSLLSCRTFERADYEALITKTAQYAAKLLKKPDQCRMVCLCSRLFYVIGPDDTNPYRNPQRVLECLQRALKIADACSMSSSANLILFVEILDYYVYYYEIENPAITDKFVSGLIALINEHFSSIGSMGSAAVEEARRYYEQVLKGIKKRKIEKGTADRFSAIVC